jgi:hypothetical protein
MIELKLKGLMIVGHKYEIFMNVCYKKSGCQTYGFGIWDTENKIGGLHVVK